MAKGHRVTLQDETPDQIIRYPFPLRTLPDGRVMKAYVELPADLTLEEAARINACINAIAQDRP